MAPDQDPTAEPEADQAPEEQAPASRYERTGTQSLAELNRQARSSERGHRPLTPQQELESLRKQKQDLGQQLAALPFADDDLDGANHQLATAAILAAAAGWIGGA